MHNEKLIDDLFEAARTEGSVRTLASVEQFVQTSTDTNISLISKWLKQNKMNILITTSGIAITAAIFLFPGSDTKMEKTITKVEQAQEVYVEQKHEDALEESPTSISRPNPVSLNIEVEDKTTDPIVEVAPEEEKLSNNDTARSQNPVKKSKLVSSEKIVAPTNMEVIEYRVILESSKGRVSADQFSEYLKNNLKHLDHEFNSSATDSVIKKFTLKLDNRHESNLRMQVSGFSTLELSWEKNGEAAPQKIWYRLDGKEIKELDFSKTTKSSIRVRYRHQEF